MADDVLLKVVTLEGGDGPWVSGALVTLSGELYLRNTKGKEYCGSLTSRETEVLTRLADAFLVGVSAGAVQPGPHDSRVQVVLWGQRHMLSRSHLSESAEALFSQIDLLFEETFGARYNLSIVPP